MARVKASKMIMVKSKIEMALVRPGCTPDMDDTRFKKQELNLNLLDVYLVQKVKGIDTV